MSFSLIKGNYRTERDNCCFSDMMRSLLLLLVWRNIATERTPTRFGIADTQLAPVRAASNVFRTNIKVRKNEKKTR